MSLQTPLVWLVMLIVLFATGGWPGAGPEGHLLQGSHIIYHNDGRELDGYGDWEYVVYQAEMDVGGNCHYSTIPLRPHIQDDAESVVIMQSAVQTTTCMTEVIIWYPAEGVEVNPITGRPLGGPDACEYPDSTADCVQEEETAVPIQG